MIHFDLPKDQSSIIKVIGVGGGGSNAVNRMFSQNIEGVNFIICNTDAQAIAQSKVPNKIQLGPNLTQGLGAGANPAIGRQATEESLEEIKKILEVNTKMAFITAGMGGGTGTGGAPIIAKICKEMGILTVGIVTTPFAYEGKKRIAQAEEGVMLLKSHVDTLLVISNDKLRHQFGNLKMKEAFNKADDILATAAKCITDVINSTGQINVDFADVCTVMCNGGVAILGSAAAEGENRAHTAIENALTSPLLNDNDILGAKWILININSAEGEHEFTMDEVEVIQNYILSRAGEDTDVILGLGYDNTLGTQIGITLIATGFDHKDPFARPVTSVTEVKKNKDEKVVMKLEMPGVTEPEPAAGKEVVEIRQPSNEINETISTSAGIEKNIGKSSIENDAPVFFEISSFTDQAPVIQFETEYLTTPAAGADKINGLHRENGSEKKYEKAGTPLSLPVKPSQIYAEPQHQDITQKEAVTGREVPDAENIFAMELVEKDAAVLPSDKKTEDLFEPLSADGQNGLQDVESEELRRRAAERISKLRNLSFNVNAADPNNEFETVPAYLRRNMEMHNQIADVENFYSNCTVKSDENNKGEINTINNFLDGKKPD